MTAAARVRPPGDKSISHRALLLAALAPGTSRLRGLLDSADVHSTARALEALGVPVRGSWSGELVVEGGSLQTPERPIDCGNSGTTARLLLGVLTGSGTGARLTGDASLRRRPMDRVVYPLQAMGGRIRYLEEEGVLPVEVEPRASGRLRPIRHRPRVASAQVKSCLLLAGLTGGARVEVLEPGRSRDHTERMLRHMGADVEFGPRDGGARVRLEGEEGTPSLHSLELDVPGDLSSAAFLLVAALLAGRSLRVEGVGLNPTRSGALEVLAAMGAGIRPLEAGERAGEPVGDLQLEPGPLRPFEIGPDLVPRLLDEIPALCVLASCVEGISRIRGAGELRVKESDRLGLLAANLDTLGVTCRELPDGLEIEGGTGAPRGTVRTGGDHRIAMAFGALRAVPGAEVEVDEPGCVEVSYPGYWDDLERLLEGGG